MNKLVKLFSTRIASVSTALVLTSTAMSVSAEDTLRAASCFPIGSPPGVAFEKVVEEINLRGKGIVKVDLIGGAPAIGDPFQVTERMAKGLYDIAGCPESFFTNIIKEAPVLRLQEVPFSTLRKNGGIDYLQDLMHQKGLHYLGRHADDGQFYIYTNKPVEKPDLTGFHIRVSPVYTSFIKEKGASVQRSGMSEIYTLLENGTVDGFGWPLRAFSPSWFAVTEYRVGPGFYHASNHVLANNKKWQSLSKEAQDVIRAVVLDKEYEAEGDSPQAVIADQKAREFQAENGVKTIEFTGEEGEKWVETANRVAWEAVLADSPEHGAKLKEYFTK